MTVRFERPVGAHLDVKELEYIIALHQSAPKLRKDGSVDSEDVMNLLVSRHGIRVDKEIIEKKMMPELGGAIGENPEPVFDLVELVAILTIPHLKKIALSNDSASIESLFGQSLKMILADVYGSVGDPPNLSPATLTEILETYGEADVPPQVIDEMLRVTGWTPKMKRHKLTVNDLIKATTSDLDRYDLDWVNRPTTHHDDVLEGASLDYVADQKEETLEDQEEGHKDGPVISKVLQMSSIDYVAETFSSKSFVTILWVLVVVLYFVYFFSLSQNFVDNVECDTFRDEFACHVVNAIVAWLTIFVQLGIIGTTFVVLASAGTSIYSKSGISSVVAILIGISAVGICSIGTYFEEGDFFFFELSRTDTFVNRAGYFTCMGIGGILLLFQLKKLLLVVVPNHLLAKLPGSSFWLVPGIAKAEGLTKKAAEFKVGKMMENALRLHSNEGFSERKSGRSSTRSGAAGNSMLNYHATANEREQCGGMTWAFKNMWNGSLFAEEGIWLHARLIACNLAQVFVAGFYIVVALYLLLPSADGGDGEVSSPAAAPASQSFGTGVPSVYNVQADVNAVLDWAPHKLHILTSKNDDFKFGFWNKVDPKLASGLSSDILSTVPDDVLSEVAKSTDPHALSAFVELAKLHANVTANCNTPQSQRRLEDQDEDEESGSELDFPKAWQIYLSLSAGGVAAVVATIMIALIFLPSAISTILKFRSGVIGSLRDADFQEYRVAPDLTNILFGSAFWGIVYTSGYLFGIVAGVVFFFVWDFTRPYGLIVIAQVIGIAVTLTTKVLILLGLRRMLFTGFFRKHPAYANIMLVVFECWSLALTVGTMLARLVKFLLISAFYIARIDAPMLAEGVGQVGPIQLDNYATQFRKDLLVHDAHRHPYMERLAAVYLLKLRYGQDFANRAGSAWRLIMVMALMPWLRRYRLGENYDTVPKEPVPEIESSSESKGEGEHQV